VKSTSSNACHKGYSFKRVQCQRNRVEGADEIYQEEEEGNLALRCLSWHDDWRTGSDAAEIRRRFADNLWILTDPSSLLLQVLLWEDYPGCDYEWARALETTIKHETYGEPVRMSEEKQRREERNESIPKCELLRRHLRICAIAIDLLGKLKDAVNC